MIRFLFFLVLLTNGTINADIVDRVIAVVNNEVITQSDLNVFRGRLKAGTLVDESLLMYRDKKTLLANEKELLNHLVDEKVIDSEVRLKELTVPIERVEQEIRSIARKNNISRKDLLSTLANQGISFSDYQGFIKQTLERQSLIEREVSSKIKISDEEVGQYFAQKRGRHQVYEYRLQHILFSYKTGKKAALEKANATLKLLNQGSSFSRLVQQNSDDPGASSDGTLGSFKTGELSKDFEAAVAGLNIGEISQVVPGPSGYHIFRMAGKSLVPDPELASQKERIRQEMFASAFQSQMKGWLNLKRQEAFVRIN